MTPELTAAVQGDREKIETLAKAIGWEVFPFYRDGYSEHPGPKLIENINEDFVFWESRDARDPQEWNPFERWSDAMMLAEAFLKSGKWNQPYFEIRSCGTEWTAVFQWSGGEYIKTGHADSGPRVISEACWRAVREK